MREIKQMVISINWITKVISVPKADLTPIQPVPEIKELNINDFHLWLRALEILTQPKNGNANLRKVIKLLGKAKFSSKRLRNKYYRTGYRYRLHP